jgi:hypothetical protein
MHCGERARHVEPRPIDGSRAEGEAYSIRSTWRKERSSLDTDLPISRAVVLR